ncbi:NB-ARC domain-containing protein [Corchorus olitorius]|uniref:NB-ARC domain-containing protein n=1 Tax=Corchorus olitorius TaxID=93759 RepID=A0A1R3I2V1_9ROSI|nr:NB-ARC domain-containing protein [Corchorus olitorius]
MDLATVNPLVERLISVLENETSSLSGLSDEIKEMKLLLMSMRSLLLDADKTGEISQREKAWVSSVRDLAYQVEDAIDEFMYHVNRRQQMKFFHRSLHFPKDLLVRHKVAAKLQDINRRMKSITDRAHQFRVHQQLEDWGSKRIMRDLSWKNRLSESSHFFRDDELVGIKKAQEELLGWLMDGEPRRTVISVIGMGGSGKTTLVANTFNKQSVKDHFEFCTWITVSQQYAIEELFRSMVKEVYKHENEEVPMNVDSMSYKSLVETLVNYFQSTRAFPNNHGVCPSHLDSMARNLVEKGQGLPLAIVALGGLMSSKRSTAEWKRVHDNLNWELSNNPTFELVKIISLLSYHDLSFQLKHCFLYCCIFPEDYEVSRKRLIRLWMAEGLLEQVNDVAPEVVAENYLMKLVSRSLLQVTRRNASGRPKAFKMHDLLREFALSISKEEKFVAVYDGRVEDNGIHRCSIMVKDKETKPAGNDDIDVECYKSIYVPENICMIKSLQVLSDVRAKDGLVKQLKGMTQLRRLSLDKLVEADEKDLCFAIGKMEHLQNLTLSSRHKAHLKIDALGSAPPYLEKLSLVGKLAKMPHWFNTLQNLTFLSLQFSQLLEDVVSRLQALPNLSYLRLSDNAFQGERLCFVDGFPKLKILWIMCCPQLKVILMHKGAMPDLRELYVTRCKELRRMPYCSELDRPHLEKVIVYDVSMELVESLCGKGNDYHLRTTPPYITLTRPDDHESNSKWICKVHN